MRELIKSSLVKCIIGVILMCSRDVLCVFEWRYGSKEMRGLFTRKKFIEYMIKVEKALLEALVDVGIAPSDALEGLETIDPAKVYELEQSIGHEVASLVFLLSEKLGETGKRYIHYGATSNDIIDTAYTLIIKDALKIIKAKLRKIIGKLMEMSNKYRKTIMVGRTHGQHALPITLGFKFANYVYELTRSYERICDLEHRLLLAKMGGAVGTMAAWSKMGRRIRELVAKKLGLGYHLISTQVAPRDGLAELASTLAILASQLDRFAVEVRELARPEIGEMWEKREEKIGSSAMPHKINPVTAERISGISRVIRSMVPGFFDNIVLWHERDLSNSSFERIQIPHIILATDQVLDDTIHLLNNLAIDSNRMKANLNLLKGHNLAEALLNALINKGLSRKEAYSIVMELSRKGLAEGKSLIDTAINDPRITKLLSRKELEDILKPENYLGEIDELIDDVLDYAAKVIGKC